MDIREKLIEILEEPCGGLYKACELADYLLDSGVTVPQWISVEDRLPEEDGYYLCCIKSSLFPDRVYIDILECDKDSFEKGHIYTDTVTHWMPLPEPPKGE